MKKIIALVISFAPLSVFAQQITDINSLSSKFSNIGDLVITLLISFSVIWIIFNVVKYLIAGNDPAARSEGGMRILWGVVGLFVILSIWGLVNILTTSFQTNKNAPKASDLNNVTIKPPTVPN